MRNSRLLTIFFIVFVDLLGFSLILPLLPYYAESFGVTQVVTGLLVASYAAAQLIGAPLLGRLSDRIEPGKIASAGMAMTALGLVLLTLIGSNTPLLMVVGILVILGIGLGLFSSPNTNAIMGSVERTSYGVASGTLGTMRLGGQMLSMGIAMMVLAIFVGNVQITPALYPAFLEGMKISMVISAAMCIAGIFFSLVRCKKTTNTGGCPR